MTYAVKEMYDSLQDEGRHSGRPARHGLYHRFLDEIKDLGPATTENLSAWIWRKVAPVFPILWRVTVRRDSDAGTCSFYGSESL
jgi:6-pyruvoyltetrahydropterin/6-carboxytetrahydropterin synthase